MKYILFIFLIILSGCTDEDMSRKVLQKEGFTDIFFTGYEPVRCWRKDQNSKTGFTARNREGKIVRGAVCCGIFGCEIKD